MTLASFRPVSLALLALAGSAVASAQGVYLTFSGGNGSEVKITWTTPITYTLTGSTLNSGVNPYFVFKAIPNAQTIFATEGAVGAGAPTYTSTGAGSSDGTQTINSFGAPSTHNNVSAGDIVFRATLDTANTLLTVGDIFTLTADSLSYTGSPNTSSTYLGALPTNGYYTTILVDAAYMNLGTGVSAIPEPSTYAAIAGAAMLGLAVWRRWRKPSGLV